jgi:hypothetical protein
METDERVQSVLRDVDAAAAEPQAQATVSSAD